MVRFEKGDKVYILESMGKKTVCSVVSSSGGFTIVRLPSGGAIRLRNSRIFPYEEEKVPAAKSPLEAAGYADPHRHMDETSRYGPMKLHGFSKTPLTYGGIKMSDKNSSFSLKINKIDKSSTRITKRRRRLK